MSLIINRIELKPRLEGLPRPTRFEDQGAVSCATVFRPQAIEPVLIERRLDLQALARPGQMQSSAEVGHAAVRGAQLLLDFLDGGRAAQLLGMSLLAARPRYFDLAARILDHHRGYESRDAFRARLSLRCRPLALHSRDVNLVPGDQAGNDPELDEDNPGADGPGSGDGGHPWSLRRAAAPLQGSPALGRARLVGKGSAGRVKQRRVTFSGFFLSSALESCYDGSCRSGFHRSCRSNQDCHPSFDAFCR